MNIIIRMTWNVLIVLLISWNGTAQPKNTVQGDTLRRYTFEEAERAQEHQPRCYAVFIHTDWCRYCHAMQKNTFTDPQVIQILNQHFYYIPLNGEQKESIHFAQNTYSYRPSGTDTGMHELAAALGTIDGALSYPTLTLLSPKNEIVFQYPGFLDREALGAILKKFML